MISTAVAVIEAPGVLRVVRCTPPLTLRQVISAHDDTCTLCLVGSAAGPLPGDDLTLDIDIRTGASATLIAAGAMIAQGRGSVPARLRINVTVGDGAHLDADPGALIVCAEAAVEMTVSIVLAETATLRWREVIVLGRTGEPPGSAVFDWDVRRGGRPLLRQRVDLTEPGRARWPGMLGDYRVLDSELRTGPALVASTEVRSSSDVTQKLAANATLTTRLTR